MRWDTNPLNYNNYKNQSDYYRNDLKIVSYLNDFKIVNYVNDFKIVNYVNDFKIVICKRFKNSGLCK